MERLILHPICGHEQTEKEFGLAVEHGTRAVLSQRAVLQNPKQGQDVAAKFSKPERQTHLASVR